MDSLPSQYYERMLWSISSGFSNLVVIGERIEDGLKSGKIQGASGGQAKMKKLSKFNSKKKDGDTNAIMGSQQAPLTQVPYYPYPYVSVIASGQYPLQGFPTPPPQQPLAIPPQNQHQQQSGYLPQN